MSKYIEVSNENNKIIIDDTIPRLCLTRALSLRQLHNTLSTSSKITKYIEAEANRNQIVNKYYVYELQKYDGEKIVALRCDFDCSDIIITAANISQTLTRIFVIVPLQASTISFEDKIHVYVYGDKIFNSGYYGLQIFNENGKIIFNSNQPPLEVKNAFSEDEKEKYSDRGMFYLAPKKYPDFTKIFDNVDKTSAVVISTSFFTFDWYPYGLGYGICFRPDGIFKRVYVIPNLNGVSPPDMRYYPRKDVYLRYYLVNSFEL